MTTGALWNLDVFSRTLTLTQVAASPGKREKTSTATSRATRKSSKPLLAKMESLNSPNGSPNPFSAQPPHLILPSAKNSVITTSTEMVSFILWSCTPTCAPTRFAGPTSLNFGSRWTLDRLLMLPFKKPLTVSKESTPTSAQPKPQLSLTLTT